MRDIAEVRLDTLKEALIVSLLARNIAKDAPKFREDMERIQATIASLTVAVGFTQDEFRRATLELTVVVDSAKLPTENL